ncbi:MAG TPA: hypothetical protein VFA37_03250 [Gaiellaceae bacterium]|nr:hypothetical protein [Gaiellaceae bacterium]
MIWLSWRQQRTETLIAAAILALLTVAFVPAGIHAADLYVQQHVARCVDRQTQACGFVVGNYVLNTGVLRGLLDSGWFNLIPGLIGVALATPILLDLENGVVRLAWTQSITRRHWIGTKLGFAVGTAVLAGAGFSALFTWYEIPFDRIFGRWDKFDFEWLAPVGYTLFALGLALAVGVLVRRSAAALVVAYGAYVAARLFVQYWLRQHLVAPLSATWGPRSAGPNLSSAWVISQVPSDKAGHPFSGGAQVFQACVRSNGDGFKGVSQACMARHGAGFTHAVYQPASRFWEFQGIEFALFAGVALLLTAFAAWRVLRTD